MGFAAESDVLCPLDIYEHFMKIGLVACFVAVLLSPFQNICGQSFTDLNFESARLVPVPGDTYGAVQFAQALPGWTESIVGAIETNALYNNIFLDSAGISIVDSNFVFYPAAVIEGRYSAIIQSGLGYTSNGAIPVNTTLSQIGMVPVGAESLQFKAYEFFDSSGAFTVTLGGQTLPLIVLGTGSNYTLYGANVSQWAGQTANLAFTVFAANPHVNDESLVLDAVQFSNQQVPEPSVSGLLCISVLVLCWPMKWLNYRPSCASDIAA